MTTIISTEFTELNFKPSAISSHLKIEDAKINQTIPTGENTMSLVTFEKGEAHTSTLILASGTHNEHASVINLVRKYQDDLEEFGPCRFQIAKSGGKPTEFALLNEQQATLIMTYMKNTPIIRTFKKALVRAFFELRDVVRGKADKTIDVNMRHKRGVTNKLGLDIKYNIDLTKILECPTAFKMKMLNRLTDGAFADVIDEMYPPFVPTPAPTPKSRY